MINIALIMVEESIKATENMVRLFIRTVDNTH